MRYVHRKVIKGKLLKRFILSAVVAGTVWVPAMVTPGVLADDMTFGKFVGDTEKGGTITVTEDTTVNSDYVSGSAPDKIGVHPYNIVINQGKKLVLNDLIMYNPHITGQGDIEINVTNNTAKYPEVYTGGLVGVTNSDYPDIRIQGNNLTITNERTGWYGSGIFVGADQKSDMDIDLAGKLNITANNYGITMEGNTSSDIDIDADSVGIDAGAWGINIRGTSSLDMNTIHDINVSAGQGISNNSPKPLNLESTSGFIKVIADTLYGVTAVSGDINLTSNANTFIVDKKGSAFDSAKIYYAVASSRNGQIHIESTIGDNVLQGGENMVGVSSDANSDKGVNLIAAHDNKVNAGINGAYSTAGTITLDAKHDNIITAGTEALKADGAQSSVKAIADRVNSITAGETIDITYDDDIPTPYADEKKVTFGKDAAAYAINGGDTPVLSGVANILAGSIYASGEGSTVDIKGIDDHLINNYIYSAAVIDGAGDLDDSEDEEMAKKSVVSALYAEGSADINVTGAQNVIRSYAESDDHDTLERVVWAYDKANITIDGTTFISTDSYQKSSNSLDIAIAAGTATNLDKETVNKELTEDERAKVTLHYGEGSAITGDILSAYAGLVTIDAKNDTAGVKITGNLLSGNNGVLNVDLGNGGTLTGRADDYGDAGVVDGSGHGTEFFDPAFSSNIYKGGEVNLTMGEGSKWTVTGQSWITKVDTGNSEHVEIDLSATDSALNKTVQALTIGEMKGNAMFTMQLDGDRKVSDMLYMKKQTASISSI